MIELDKIYNEDCLIGMQRIPDGSVDCCITDPPYKLTEGGCRGGRLKINSVSRDKFRKNEMFGIPPFEMWMSEVYRVLKDGTHFYCMTNDKNLKDIIISAESVGFKEVNILVWAKRMHTPLWYYMKNVEFVALFRKGRARRINNLGDFALIDKYPGIFGNKVHPSEKPVELFQRFAENSTNQDDLILDPFIGSGTLSRACIRSNRHYIGFELNKEYYDKAVQRIAAEQPTLFT